MGAVSQGSHARPLGTSPTGPARQRRHPRPPLDRRPPGRAAQPGARDPRHRHRGRPPAGRGSERAGGPGREGDRGGGGTRRPHPGGEGVRRSHRGRAEAGRPAPGRPQHRHESDPVPEGHPLPPRRAPPRAGRGGRRDARGDEDTPALHARRHRAPPARRRPGRARAPRSPLGPFPRRDRGVPADVPPGGPPVPAGPARGDALPACRDRRRCGRRLVRHVRPARGRHRPRDRRRGGPRPAGGIADGQDAQRPPRARADGRDGPRHPPAGR